MSATEERWLGRGRSVLESEGMALLEIARKLGDEFVGAVGWMLECRGRILVTGLGKSGIVARKVAATLTSTGTPALFVHPVEALHGDLGIATADDLLLAISRSGSNHEILSLAASLRGHGVRCLALTCDAQSELAKRADLVLHTPIVGEACPLGLSPTTSTTAALALGDALAMALLEARGFAAHDFAVLHPNGALGRGLRTTVAELMHQGPDLPLVEADATLRDALPVLSSKRLGCACVVTPDGRLAGFLSDGDVRRALQADAQPLDRPVREFMGTRPRTVEPECLAREALRRMETNEPGPITQLVVVREGRPIGVLHLHDVLRAGIRAN